jgi:hypothetical protein
MKMRAIHLLEFLFVLLMGAVLVSPQAVHAQNHVVTPEDLQKDTSAASSTRQKNLGQVEGFLSTPEAQQAMKSTHVNSQQVRDAIPQLNDDELAQLSARSEKAQKDFAGGRISDRELIFIVLAILALILIIVAVR